MNCAQCDHSFVGSLVVRDSHAVDGQENCTCLPHFVVEIPFFQTVDKNGVYFLQNTNFFGSNITQNTNCQSGTWKRMPSDEVRADAQDFAHTAYFVFK